MSRIPKAGKDGMFTDQKGEKWGTVAAIARAMKTLRRGAKKKPTKK